MLNVSGVTSNSTCGYSNGEITVIPIGGTGPYAYNWTNGANTQSINGLTAISYSVTVTDANSCVANGTFKVKNIAGPSLSAASNQCRL